MDAKDRIIEEQRQLIGKLRREIEELKLALAKATKDSSNSSKSPSSDIVKPPKNSSSGRAVRKKRKRGGQPGHSRRLRQPLPPDSSDAANVSARFEVVELADGGRYDRSEDYFRFMFTPDVEPTNNHTEQQVRHCVFDRRITQGTRSKVGQGYHQRMWTALATCAKQGRSFFHFLHESIAANLDGQTPPSLLKN